VPTNSDRRYCDEVGRNRLTEPVDEQLFKAIRRTDSHAPIYLVLTKVDEFKTNARHKEYEELKKLARKLQDSVSESDNSDYEHDEEKAEQARVAADKVVQQRAKKIMDRFKEKCPYEDLCERPILVSHRKRHGYEELVEVTRRRLPEIQHKLLVSHQICNVDAKIEICIDSAIYHAKAVTRTAAIPAGADISLVTKAAAGPRLAHKIQETFGFNVYNADVIWTIVSDCLWNDPAAQVAYGSTLLAACAAIVYLSPAMPVAIVLASTHAAVNVPRSARMFLMIAADLILTFERAHWFHYHNGHGEDTDLTAEDVRQATAEYKKKMSDVHTMTVDKFPLHSAFQILSNPSGMREVLVDVIDKHRFKKKRTFD
jgi:hypothetical protein